MVHRVNSGVASGVVALVWIALLCGAPLVLLAPSAQADELEARAAFEQAEAAFEAGEFVRAAELFQKANQQAPHPSVIFNAAVSWDHAGEIARAATAYSAALQNEGLTPEQSEESERRLATLVERLGYVQIAKPIGGLVSVDHIAREPIPARFYLSPGSYEVKLETPDGQRTTTSIGVSASETLKVSLNPMAVAPLPPPEVIEPEPLPLPPPVEPRQPSSTQRTLGWISIGVGAVAAGAAIYLGSEFDSKRDQFRQDRSNAGLRQDAADARTQMLIATGGAGVAGGLGLVLLLTAPTIEF